MDKVEVAKLEKVDEHALVNKPQVLIEHHEPEPEPEPEPVKDDYDEPVTNENADVNIELHEANVKIHSPKKPRVNLVVILSFWVI